MGVATMERVAMGGIMGGGPPGGQGEGRGLGLEGKGLPPLYSRHGHPRGGPGGRHRPRGGPPPSREAGRGEGGREGGQGPPFPGPRGEAQGQRREGGRAPRSGCGQPGGPGTAAPGGRTALSPLRKRPLRRRAGQVRPDARDGRPDHADLRLPPLLAGPAGQGSKALPRLRRGDPRGRPCRGPVLRAPRTQACPCPRLQPLQTPFVTKARTTRRTRWRP